MHWSQQTPFSNNTRERGLYIRTLPNGEYRNQIDYILCSLRWRSCKQSAKTRPGADCGSDHELLIAKFKLKLKFLHKKMQNHNKFSPVAQLCPTLCEPYPSDIPRAYLNSCPSRQWYHPTTSSRRPFLFPPSIFPSIRVFSNESTLRMKWPKNWSFRFNISPSNEHPGLISFRMD